MLALEGDSKTGKASPRHICIGCLYFHPWQTLLINYSTLYLTSLHKFAESTCLKSWHLKWKSLCHSCFGTGKKARQPKKRTPSFPFWRQFQLTQGREKSPLRMWSVQLIRWITCTRPCAGGDVNRSGLGLILGLGQLWPVLWFLLPRSQVQPCNQRPVEPCPGSPRTHSALSLLPGSVPRVDHVVIACCSSDMSPLAC